MKKYIILLIMAFTTTVFAGPPSYPPGLTFWTGAGGGDIAYMGGNVGIGTATPSELLSISGLDDVYYLATSTAANSDSGIEFANDASKWRVYVWGGGSDKLNIRNTTTAVSVMTMTKTGEVGVGETAPLVKLHLTGGLILGNEAVTCGDGTNVCAYSAAFTSSYYTTDDDADGADVVTVTDGVAAGQRRTFVLKTDAGDDLAITPSNFANGAAVTLDTAGESVTLEFDGTNWFIVCHYGGVIS